MVDGDLGPEALVAHHAIDVLRPGGSRDQDDRNRLAGLVDRLHVEQGPGQNESIRLKLEQRFKGDRLAFGDPDAGVEERPVAPFECLSLDAGDHVCEERVMEVGEQNTEDLGSLLHEASGHRVRPVVELLDGLEHRGAALVAHVRRFLHHERHEGLGDPGSFRHVVDRWPAHQSYAPITRWS